MCVHGHVTGEVWARVQTLILTTWEACSYSRAPLAPVFHTCVKGPLSASEWSDGVGSGTACHKKNLPQNVFITYYAAQVSAFRDLFLFASYRLVNSCSPNLNR